MASRGFSDARAEGISERRLRSLPAGVDEHGQGVRKMKSLRTYSRNCQPLFALQLVVENHHINQRVALQYRDGFGYAGRKWGTCPPFLKDARQVTRRYRIVFDYKEMRTSVGGDVRNYSSFDSGVTVC
jgi:hypothetical protein